MKNGIYISIRPEHTNRIENLIKNYEFRNYIPRKKIDYLIVYETFPTCKIKYIIEIDDIVEYPNKIDEKGYGNKDFNEGLKKVKYAYHIKHLKKLSKPILLKKLREKYNFTPPQSYAYFEKYPELTKLIFNEKNIVLK